MRTEVIAASAGTGKTYRLAAELKQELLHAERRTAPERVVAVTFTRAAAAELEARVRRALLDASEVTLARRLGAARIGTLHAVCARMVREHAFELGLSPELQTLDDHLAERALHTALEQHVGEEQRQLLDELDVRFGGFAWRVAVKLIIDQARSNALDAAQLIVCADRSVADLLAALPEPGDGAALEADLIDVIEKVLAMPEPKLDDARNERADLNDMRRSLKRGDPLPWPQWLGLAKSHMSALRRFGHEHVKHPGLRGDLERATRMLFEIAAGALARYDDDKRVWGVFDFVDQETFALRLLRDPAVRPRLQEQIGLVLVDEFQDTSPLQLAILSELSALAEKTIFVGDQKQAIFGFRGTDPALMEAVVDKLATVQTAPLDVSYRSRPGLVALTSALFEPAFGDQGVPPERVRVRAALEVEPPGLGAFIERWRLDDGRGAGEVAAGVAELLEDPDVRVRDGAELVAVKAKHIAVLTRTNIHARAVAEALTHCGVPVVLRRRGLAATTEARALMAGLALFQDGFDVLAAAELTRLGRGAADPSQWLTDLVEKGAKTAFVEDPWVAAVAKVAAQHRQAGLVLALDLVVEALRLRDACAAWGDAAQRLANLGALRALAARFVDERMAIGAGATITGFLARLDELADINTADDDEDDAQGDVAGQDAVEVCTWHKSKGREWPIVVLTQIVDTRPGSIFGVFVESDALSVDVAEPLRSRWVRCWPNPYGSRREDGGLLAHLAEHDAMKRLDAAARREELRLLYVGWTRARDRLVLAGSFAGPGSPHERSSRWDLWSGAASLLRHLHSGAEQGARPLLSEPHDDGKVTWAGIDVEVKLRKPLLRPAKAPPIGGTPVVAPRAARNYAPAFSPPSSAVETGEADAPIVLGAPIVLRTFADDDTMARLGTAVHGFFAADVALPDDNARFRLAERLLKAWDVGHLMGPDDVVTAANRLQVALTARYPGARLFRESPVTQRLPEGTVVRGQMDLVVETPDGFVIVDHKTYMLGADPATTAGADAVRSLAATFAGQLKAYARALAAATGRPVTETLAHLPLSAALVPVRWR